jgi:hypothetical protein
MFGGAPNEFFFNSNTARYRIHGVELTGTLTPAESLEIFGAAAWLKARGTGDDGVERDRMPYTPAFTFQTRFSWHFIRAWERAGRVQAAMESRGFIGSMPELDPPGPATRHMMAAVAFLLPFIALRLLLQ